MTLRAKFALALALISAVSAIAVALIGYRATDNRLHNEVDDTLQSYVARFSDPDGNLATALCTPPARTPGDTGASFDFANEFRGLPGVTVQCVTRAGVVVNSVGPSEPPIDTDEKHPHFNEDTDDHNYRVVTLASPTGDTIRISRSLDETNAVLESVRNQYIGLVLAVSAVAALVGLFVARQTTRPIRSLTRSAEEIAGTGNLDVAMPKPGVDEIGRLAQAFGAMIGALRESKDQQQQLVQDASHELRTPLSSLRTNIDILRRYSDLPESDRARVLGDLDEEFRELTTLVNELIALAADRYDDEPLQPVDLVSVVNTVAERASRRSGREVNVTGESCDIAGKPQLIARAVGNLVENAIKFSGDAAPIEVAISDHELTVRDHGPGVSEYDMPFVFDRFYRSTESRSRPGSGLGLAIVRQIMSEVGGTVSVANHPDRGAVFTLTFREAAATSE